MLIYERMTELLWEMRKDTESSYDPPTAEEIKRGKALRRRDARAAKKRKTAELSPTQRLLPFPRKEEDK
tara:strand:- start:151 stop:357 length:207 start_codon:yes stop_codon:yes gene_type:complete